MDNMKAVIAKNITELRKNKGYTQMELAEQLNYSDKAVSKWERGESLPDISVLVEIADLFDVTLDYLVKEEHPKEAVPGEQVSGVRKEFVTGISVLLAWLVAMLVFVSITLASPEASYQWLAFVYAVPVSMIIWLVFNSVWFSPRRNYFIVSLLMWSALFSIWATALPFGQNVSLIFLLGIPGQLIIVSWALIKKNPKTPEIKESYQE